MSTFRPVCNKTSKRQANRFRPRVETLEDRRMLAAHPWLDWPDEGRSSGLDHDRFFEESRVGPADNASPESSRDVTVMSWNLYLGGDLTPVLDALVTGDSQQIVQAVSALWQSVLATNFEVRAAAIADQIEFAQPTLIGLQEAVVWQTGPVSPEPATNVQFDFTQILLDELSDRGLHYGVVAQTPGIDAELTGFTTPPNPSNPAGVLEDIRLTDHDVILARTDLPKSQLKLSNVQEENFDAALTLPGGIFTVLRGWNSVDVKIRGKEFRLINTHLEIAAFPAVQVAQATELLSTAAATDMAVVLLGDFNSSAVPGQPNDTPTYELLIGAGFEDTWDLTQVTESFTCCQAPDLRNESSILDSRIDLVLIRGPVEAIDADVVGEEQADRTIPLPNAPSGLWPSDHAGVLAALVIPSRQRGPQPFQFADFGARLVAAGDHCGDEDALANEITVETAVHTLDELWKLAGRRQDGMLTACANRVFAMSFHEDDDADLLEVLANRLAGQDGYTRD